MRTAHEIAKVMALMVAGVSAFLIIYRIVAGPTNFLFPGLGLVVSMEAVIVAFISLTLFLVALVLLLGWILSRK